MSDDLPICCATGARPHPRLGQVIDAGAKYQVQAVALPWRLESLERSLAQLVMKPAAAA